MKTKLKIRKLTLAEIGKEMKHGKMMQLLRYITNKKLKNVSYYVSVCENTSKDTDLLFMSHTKNNINYLNVVNPTDLPLNSAVKVSIVDDYIHIHTFGFDYSKIERLNKSYKNYKRFCGFVCKEGYFISEDNFDSFL